MVLFGGFTVFLIIIAGLIAPSFLKPDVRTFLPTPIGTARHSSDSGPDTVTIDAGDEHAWRFFHFDRGVLAPPDTTGWDLAIRRFRIVPSGGIVNVGALPFADVSRAPDSGYVATRFGRDTLNPAIYHWYAYSYVSHLLSPKGDVYVVRRRDGRYAKLQILSYYCPGPTPGCVTIHYQPLNR